MTNVFILLLGLFFVAVCVVGLVRLIALPRARTVRQLSEIDAYGSVAASTLCVAISPGSSQVEVSRVSRDASELWSSAGSAACGRSTSAPS